MTVTIGSGLGGFLAASPETTFGTYVAPSRSIEIESASLKKKKKTVQGGGIAAGLLVDRGSRRVVTTADAAGDIKAEVCANTFGLYIAQAMGSTATPVQQAATAAYLQTHAFSNQTGQSMSVQIGIPSTDGTLNPYSFTGCKIIDFELSCALDKMLTATFGVDAKDVSEAQSLITPSFVTTDPFHFGQMYVKIGTFGSEATVQGVTGVDVKLSRPVKNDRFYANNSGRKAEQIQNGRGSITGKISADFVAKADFADRFASDTPVSVIIGWQGALIATVYYELLEISLPQVFFDADPPALDSYDIVSTDYSFTALYDNSHNAMTVKYQSTDTTI